MRVYISKQQSTIHTVHCGNIDMNVHYMYMAAVHVQRGGGRGAFTRRMCGLAHLPLDLLRT